MKSSTYLGKILSLLLLSLLIYSCSGNEGDANGDVSNGIDDPNEPASVPSIAELVSTVDVLSTLADALEVADDGLVEALSTDGQLTVFAPTNDAFGNFLNDLDGFGSLDDFNEEEEKELLAEILKYHVVHGIAVSSTDFSDGQVLATLQTEELSIALNNGVLVRDKTEDASVVTTADNEASNGVVHIIDKVLLPQAILNIIFPPLPSIVELIDETEELSLFGEAVTRTGYDDGGLNDDGSFFTVFAPSNTAIQFVFDRLGNDFNSYDDIEGEIQEQLLEDMLRYHIAPSIITAENLVPGTVTTLLQDDTIEVKASGNTFVLDDGTGATANLTETNKVAKNGVIHIIDKVLLPQQVQNLANNPPN